MQIIIVLADKGHSVTLAFKRRSARSFASYKLYRVGGKFYKYKYKRSV